MKKEAYCCRTCMMYKYLDRIIFLTMAFNKVLHNSMVYCIHWPKGTNIFARGCWRRSAISKTLTTNSASMR